MFKRSLTFSVKFLRYFVLFPLFSFLPRKLGYRLAEFAYRYDPLLRRPTRQAVSQSIVKVFPELSNDQAKLEQGLNEYQSMFGRELLDVYFLARLNARNIHEWVKVEGLDILTAALAKGNGVVLSMAHYGRPSLLFAVLGILGYKLNILTQIIDERNADLDWCDRTFLRYKVKINQSHTKGEWITVGENPKRLYRLLSSGEIVVILFDVRSENQDSIARVPFLGKSLNVPNGVLRLSKKTGSQVLYGVVHESNRGAKVSIRELPADPDLALYTAVGELESDIRCFPFQWWQWNIFDYLVK